MVWWWRFWSSEAAKLWATGRSDRRKRVAVGPLLVRFGLVPGHPILQSGRGGSFLDHAVSVRRGCGAEGARGGGGGGGATAAALAM